MIVGLIVQRATYQGQLVGTSIHVDDGVILVTHHMVLYLTIRYT